ncbi:MAG: VWA domain-containing protein, partial [Candidatus Aminicenantes bacterium]|nr:VWA domain-containing protein [Candidatus Aminicenantes bacterium]
WTGTLKDGKAQVTWFGPADKAKKVEITLTYLGDEKDPAIPDIRYKESETTIKLPRALATEIVVKTTPDPKTPKRWEIEVKVKDELGRDVVIGKLEVEVSDGSVEFPGTQKTGCDLANTRPLKFPFFAPDDPKRKAKITVKYHGDIEDPNVPDELYKDSDKTFSLPPELALTSIEVKTSKVDPNNPKSNDWAMEIEVKEESGAYVSMGDLIVTCDEGAIEAKGQTSWTGTLAGGKATVKWLGPDDPQTKAVVTIKYLGDQKDPALPDLKYGEAEKTVKMPPRQLRPTTVNVTPSLVDEKRKIWKLETEVKDDKGAPVTKGSVRYTATGGSFKDASPVLDVTMTLQNGTYLKAWKQTDDDVQTITAKYLGDEADPAKEDVLYEESQASLKLPPELLEKSTVFVIDASGSMAGAKLASAKEAVRAALAGYMGKENKEEWALYAFFDCGSIRLLQGFTRDPARITAQLGFDASGSTPIAASIRAARNYLLRAARGKTGRIILLSDGGENCQGEPVEEAKSIRVRTLTVDLGR